MAKVIKTKQSKMFLFFMNLTRQLQANSQYVSREIRRAPAYRARAHELSYEYLDSWIRVLE